MSRWISHNLSLFLLSLLLAFFFWAVATEAEDPTRVDTFPTQIPVEIRGLREGLTTYGAEDARIRVEIRAPASIWDRLQTGDIEAYIDLSTVQTGTVEVPVQVFVELEPSTVTDRTPEQIELTVERIAEKEVPVDVQVQGSPSLGFMISEREVVPQSVRIRGPESYVRRVQKASIQVSVEGQQSDLRDDFRPIPVDETGQRVQQVEIMPESVTVRIPIVQWLNTRDVPVKPNLIGQPAPGYGIANVRYAPQVVTVYGRADVLNATTTVQTAPINLEGITQTLETSVPLQLPTGLSILSGRPTVTVTLTVDAIRSALNLEIVPTIQGLSPELTATVGLESILVILNGPISVMEALEPAEVEAVLDLSDLTPGEYNIIPEVTVPDGVDIEQILPEEVPVQIEEAPDTEETVFGRNP
ncbi:MAG: CdaR family protein [Anaerolineae bacterium]